ncbi:unnamed protein product [Pleuronectes platessa]|uniref:Uncharacterized protein n=1 Tax=Pleuronectes platessa TaxID=8262 RepID=A0A9N7USK2_PLEPL|nr:unnamed protein product [Pleuronectes platessa]
MEGWRGYGEGGEGMQERGSVSYLCLVPFKARLCLQASLRLRGLPPCGRIPDRTQTHTQLWPRACAPPTRSQQASKGPFKLEGRNPSSYPKTSNQQVRLFLSPVVSLSPILSLALSLRGDRDNAVSQ